MPVQVELSDRTFSRLQKLAVPLVDSIETVVARLLDAKEAAEPKSVPKADAQADAVPAYPAAEPPDLTHTKPIALSFNGAEILKPSWKGLLVAAIYAAHSGAKRPGDLKRLLIVPHVKGKKEDEGYQYLADIDLSYQGQDANSAWKAAYHVAQQLGLPIVAEFVWRHKEKAAFPGQPGRLASGVTRTAA